MGQKKSHTPQLNSSPVGITEVLRKFVPSAVRFHWHPIEFSLNVFTEFAEFSNKKYLSLKGFEPVVSSVRDQGVTTLHTHGASKIQVIGSLN